MEPQYDMRDLTGKVTETLTTVKNYPWYNGWKHDNAGNLVYDADGNKIPTDTDWYNTSTVTVNPTADGTGEETGAVTSSYDSLDLSNQAHFTISTPGDAFQFTQTYSGPGLTNQTIIQRTTVVESVTDTTSTFTQ